MNKMPSLTLSGVSYQYSTAHAPAVNEVTCDFKPGVMYAVVGPSGSGKSTLLSLLAGLDTPTEGAILFGGTNLASMDLDLYRRTGIAMIFQAFQLFPLMTALENVCYPLELCGVKTADAKPRAEKLLGSVGITPEQMKRYPSHLSGGEQQRVAIARSLASGAKILLADEPTGNLDGANTQNIMGILKRLAHDDGYCVIVVTHDLEAAAAADTVYKMRDGVLTRAS
jgi:putative ABC transport system ATP-binding protein